MSLFIYESQAVLKSAFNTALHREGPWWEGQMDRSGMGNIVFIISPIFLHLSIVFFPCFVSVLLALLPWQLHGSSSSHRGRLVWVFLTGQIEVSLLPLSMEEMEEGEKRGTGECREDGCKEEGRRTTCRVKINAGMQWVIMQHQSRMITFYHAIVKGTVTRFGKYDHAFFWFRWDS